MDAAALRRHFPVFEEIAYLNAGSCGPLPGAALRAGADAALDAAEHGRGRRYFEHTLAVRDRLRERYARAIGAQPGDVSVTTSTSDGMVRVLAALDLRPGDEVLTAPDEHPGLLGPLAALRRAGVVIKTAPFDRLADAVEPTTRLVACSHVSWVTGALCPAELADVGREIPVLLDGAQGAGAVPIDLDALNCAFYTGAGQKWLCGPVGLGLLWIAPAWRGRLSPSAPTYLNLEEPALGLDAEPFTDGRAFDAFSFSGQSLAAGDAAAALLEDAGWPEVFERAASLAERFADALRERGRTVAPRGRTTLVSWEDADPEGLVERCVQAGVLIRFLPGTPYARASVGAWNDESDLERLLACV